MSKVNTTAYQQLVQANVQRVSQGMFSLIDRLQTLPPGEQVASAALLTSLVAERFGVPIADAMRTATNILADDHFFANGETFSAAREYLKKEVKA
jgi:hypothetical protein